MAFSYRQTQDFLLVFTIKSCTLKPSNRIHRSGEHLFRTKSVFGTVTAVIEKNTMEVDMF